MAEEGSNALLSGFTENASNYTPFDLDASNVVNRESNNLHQRPNTTNNKNDRAKAFAYDSKDPSIHEIIDIEGLKLVDLSMSQ